MFIVLFVNRPTTVQSYTLDLQLLTTHLIILGEISVNGYNKQLMWVEEHAFMYVFFFQVLTA